MEEIFRDVKGYEGHYEVSNFGRVRSTSYKGVKILTPSKTKRGYLNVIFCINQKKEHKLVHRLVAEAFIDNPNSLKTVNHKNGNKSNNNVENLEWCSQEDNNKHAKENGLLQRYEDRPEAKLTKGAVKMIPKLIELGATTDDLKTLFNVSRRCIDNIFEGKNWSDLGIDFTKLKPCRKIKNKPSEFQQMDNTELTNILKAISSVTHRQ